MDEHADLFPKFHSDRDGNIVAYANGKVVLISRANRKRDVYSDADADRRDSNPNTNGDGPTNGDAQPGD